MKTALLSVYNKAGIADFAKELIDLGWMIIASDGTAKALSDIRRSGQLIIPVNSMVGDPILGHRVVTLSRKISAGLLSRDEDEDELKRLGIRRIDLVCVDLYPLQDEIDNPKSTQESVIEKTDIGGPTLLRAAAKGRRITICDSADRMRVIDWLKNGEPDKEDFITELAAKAEYTVAKYCLDSARYHSRGNYDGFIGRKVANCKYGENAWQEDAGLFSFDLDNPLVLDKFELVEGSPLGYNNYCDIDRLLQTFTHLIIGLGRENSELPIAIGVKHGNPCGASIGNYPHTNVSIIKKMLKGDPQAIFGGAVITNFLITEKEARTLIEYKVDKGKRVLDIIIAPDFTEDAIKILRRKNGGCRLLKNYILSGAITLDNAKRFRYVRGGFLRQDNYNFILDLTDERIKKFGKATQEQIEDMLFAWSIGSTSNSNTTTIVRNRMLLSNGVAEQSRVSSCELAVKKARDAGHRFGDSVAYTDSFFPFLDGPRVLANAGVNAILASSGSIRDGEVIEFCKYEGIVLYMIPDKIGRGFFGH